MILTAGWKTHTKGLPNLKDQWKLYNFKNRGKYWEKI